MRHFDDLIKERDRLRAEVAQLRDLNRLPAMLDDHHRFQVADALDRSRKELECTGEARHPMPPIAATSFWAAWLAPVLRRVVECRMIPVMRTWSENTDTGGVREANHYRVYLGTASDSVVFGAVQIPGGAPAGAPPLELAAHLMFILWGDVHAAINEQDAPTLSNRTTRDLMLKLFGSDDLGRLLATPLDQLGKCSELTSEDPASNTLKLVFRPLGHVARDE